MNENERDNSNENYFIVTRSDLEQLTYYLNYPLSLLEQLYQLQDSQELQKLEDVGGEAWCACGKVEH